MWRLTVLNLEKHKTNMIEEVLRVQAISFSIKHKLKVENEVLEFTIIWMTMDVIIALIIATIAQCV